MNTFGMLSMLLPEPADKILCGLGSGKLSHCPAISQELGHRNAAHAETPGELRVLLSIDLHHRDFSRQPFSYCSHRRCE